ncbi:MAG: hypothetical protein CMG71_03400 [Candidatus Marinimicrobia bacterium]|nr:hypothetical protein [Candidatus Neomarinimicrobiota bacterium]|tara:strand:- start:8411 stop:9181 length:771 start_codon:yes stop_codon:yes gene_type:complete
MLTFLLTLTLVLFAAIFPLFLWIVERETVEMNIHRFILGLSLAAGVAGLLLTFSLNVPDGKLVTSIWLGLLFAVTLLYWPKSRVSAWIIIFPSLLGVGASVKLISFMVLSGVASVPVMLLGGLIFSGSLFAMILGHWYLNVVDLPITLLRNATRLILVLLIIRLIWNVIALLFQSVMTEGYLVPLTEFLFTIDGIFLATAILFGTVLPLILVFLTLRTVAIQSTQSATGLLYVLVLSVAMGDLIYKYYAIQYGLIL